jgi:WD40 repeat protein
MPMADPPLEAEALTAAQSGGEVPAVGPALPALPGYEVLEELGRGGMGVVYRVRQVDLGRIVALKVIRAGGHAVEADLARFRAEAKAIARLQHPNIVQIFEVGEHEGLPYFSLEYCPGGSLEKRLQGAPLAVREAAALVAKLARAVEAAHEAGIVHRDLKPANVLLSGGQPFQADGPNVKQESLTYIPKVTDFGLAKQVGDVRQTDSNAILGTPSYMAPEQAQGSRDVGPLTDVYALGAILYECLTGRPPFQAATPLDTILQVLSQEPVPPRQLNSVLPRDLETICLKCLEKDPQRRYGSAGALADDLGRFLDGAPVAARPVGSLARAWRWARRQPAAAALVVAAVVAVLALGGLVVGLVDARRLREARDEVEGQRSEAVEARDRLEQLSYHRNLLLAEREWEGNNVERMGELLAACPPGRRGWEWRYLDRVRRQTGVGVDTGQVEVFPLAVSPNGRLVVCGDPIAGRLRLLELETGRELRRLGPQRRYLWGAAFSPDGTLLASTSSSPATPGDLVVWNFEHTADGPRCTERFRRRNFTSYPSPLAFSPDGKVLAVAGAAPFGANSEVLLLDARSNARLHRLPTPTVAWDLAFSSDGAWLAAGTWTDPQVPKRPKATVLLWRAATGKEIRRLTVPELAVTAVRFTGGNRFVAIAGESGPARLLHLADLRTAWLLPGAENAETLAVDSEGRRLAVAGADRVVRLYDVQTQEKLGELRGCSAGLSCLAWHPDRRRLLAGGMGRTYRIWDITRLPGARVLRGHDGPVMEVAVSPDGRWLASAGRDQTVRLWDIRRGRQRRLGPLPQPVWGVAFSPDGRRVACGIGDWRHLHQQGAVWVWNAVTGERVLHLEAHPALVRSVAYSSDGKYLATGGGELHTRGEVSLREADTGRVLHTFRLPKGVWRVRFSPDGRRLAALVSYANEWRAWDATGGKEVARVRVPNVDILALAFHPDGDRVAVGGTDGAVSLWSLAAEKRVASFRGHTAAVFGLAYTPDRTRFASASSDNTIKVWDAETAQEVLALKGHRGPVNSVVFAPDGSWLASCSDDGTVMLWETGRGVP